MCIRDRYMGQYKMLSESSQFSVGLQDDDIFVWNVCFEGPTSTLYEGGIYSATLTFPRDYPNNPPKLKFVTEMWHPNIYADGTVCISILHSPEGDQFNEHELPEEKWRPILTPEDVLISVLSLLNDPNLDSPANIDAAVQFRNEREAYKKKVKAIARKTMEGGA
eukprot:TRINITY_DN6819_c0_g1_i7.p1 TRINITY_DN6819_c0_g1~~TRINITY_DN6819_c0_g1_i7.p1  ORF type:complete len:180 (-),score=42.40 TRINITY_DN6819_c0_g1_i7:114-605(-)